MHLRHASKSVSVLYRCARVQQGLRESAHLYDERGVRAGNLPELDRIRGFTMSKGVHLTSFFNVNANGLFDAKGNTVIPEGHLVRNSVMCL